MMSSLVAARLELHYAAQILAACADARLPHREDDGHTAMIWRDRALVSETGLVLRCLDLTLVAADGAELALAGKRLAEALAWADAGAKLRDYDLPPRSNETFVASPELSELAGWFDEGTRVVGQHSKSMRVWPHHFDLGAVLDDGIGIGLSPGDKYYAEPYFYVTPPRPIAATPTIAGGGAWRTELWQGAVLTASQRGDADAFMASAIAAIRRFY